MATLVNGATTLTFELLISQPGYEQTAAVTVRHIPGGNNAYIDRGGQRPATMSGAAKLDSFAEFTTLRSLVGSECTLTYSEATYTVVLTDVRRRQVLKNAQIADLSMVIVA